jgi:2-methylcitrate dehydratase PrpD
MNETRELANFITGVSYHDLSNEVVDKAKGLILDQFGCQLAFATMPWGQAVFKYIKDRKGSREESTVVNYGLRTTAEDAALANATFGHGFEMDDTELHSITHPGCVVIPAALATGEMEGISGKEFLTAVVIGYDVMTRIGTAVRTMINRWFHGTPVSGTFGAAAATAKILGLTTDAVLNALSISASSSGGIGEHSETGGSVKRLHPGFAAQAGIRASFLARNGITGPPTALEGKKGFCQAFANEYFLEEITDGLGKEFRILWTGNKPYCCCAAQHSTIDATSKIAEEHNLKPEEVEEIEEIIVQGKQRDVKSVGSIIEPGDITAAQFSGRFGIALRLIKGGNRFQDYTEENLRDPEILGLAKRVKYVAAEELEKLPVGGAPARVTIKLKDGTVHEEQVNYARGTIQNPMTKAELEDKFRGLASMALSDDRIEKIIRTVDALEELDKVDKLGLLLVASEGDVP